MRGQGKTTSVPPPAAPTPAVARTRAQRGRAAAAATASSSTLELGSSSGVGPAAPAFPASAQDTEQTLDVGAGTNEVAAAKHPVLRLKIKRPKKSDSAETEASSSSAAPPAQGTTVVRGAATGRSRIGKKPTLEEMLERDDGLNSSLNDTVQDDTAQDEFQWSSDDEQPPIPNPKARIRGEQPSVPKPPVPPRDKQPPPKPPGDDEQPPPKAPVPKPPVPPRDKQLPPVRDEQPPPKPPGDNEQPPPAPSRDEQPPPKAPVPKAPLPPRDEQQPPVLPIPKLQPPPDPPVDDNQPPVPSVPKPKARVRDEQPRPPILSDAKLPIPKQPIDDQPPLPDPPVDDEQRMDEEESCSSSSSSSSDTEGTSRKAQKKKKRKRAKSAAPVPASEPEVSDDEAASAASKKKPHKRGPLTREQEALLVKKSSKYMKWVRRFSEETGHSVQFMMDSVGWVPKKTKADTWWNDHQSCWWLQNEALPGETVDEMRLRCHADWKARSTGLSAEEWQRQWEMDQAWLAAYHKENAKDEIDQGKRFQAMGRLYGQLERVTKPFYLNMGLVVVSFVLCSDRSDHTACALDGIVSNTDLARPWINRQGSSITNVLNELCKEVTGIEPPPPRDMFSLEKLETIDSLPQPDLRQYGRDCLSHWQHTLRPDRAKGSVTWKRFADQVVAEGMYIDNWPIDLDILDVPASKAKGGQYDGPDYKIVIDALLHTFNDPDHAKAIKFRPLSADDLAKRYDDHDAWLNVVVWKDSDGNALQHVSDLRTASKQIKKRKAPKTEAATALANKRKKEIESAPQSASASTSTTTSAKKRKTDTQAELPGPKRKKQTASSTGARRGGPVKPTGGGPSWQDVDDEQSLVSFDETNSLVKQRDGSVAATDFSSETFADNSHSFLNNVQGFPDILNSTHAFLPTSHAFPVLAPTQGYNMLGDMQFPMYSQAQLQPHQSQLQSQLQRPQPQLSQSQPQLSHSQSQLRQPQPLLQQSQPQLQQSQPQLQQSQSQGQQSQSRPATVQPQLHVSQPHVPPQTAQFLQGQSQLPQQPLPVSQPQGQVIQMTQEMFDTLMQRINSRDQQIQQLQQQQSSFDQILDLGMGFNPASDGGL